MKNIIVKNIFINENKKQLQIEINKKIQKILQRSGS